MRSLRTTILGSLLTVVSVVLIVLSIITVAQVRSNELDRLRQLQRERVTDAVSVYEKTKVVTLDAELNAILPEPLAQALDSPATVATYVSDTETITVWAAQHTSGGIISVHGTFPSTERSQASLIRVMVVTSLGTLVVTAIVGFWIASAITSRLRRASEASIQLDKALIDLPTAQLDEVSQQVGPAKQTLVEIGEHRDEVGELARAIDSLWNTVIDSLASERRFTADVAHDLRTPITGLLMAAELLEPSRPTDMVKDRAQALRQLVEELLEISRLDAGREITELTEIDVLTELTSTLNRWHDSIPGEVDIEVIDHGGNHTTVTDPRRLRRIITNLLDNARKHGEPPIHVVVEGTTITVLDRGTGFPEELTLEGPRRFRTGVSERGTGHGLGLVISAAHARALDAQLWFANWEDGTSRAILQLDPIEDPPSSNEPS